MKRDGYWIVIHCVEVKLVANSDPAINYLLSFKQQMATISRSLRSSLLVSSRRRLIHSTPSSPDPSLGKLPSSQSSFTTNLAFFNAILPEGHQIPTYRVLDGFGNIIEDATAPEVRNISLSTLSIQITI